MTIPGIIQAILIAICCVGSYQWYFEKPGQIIGNVFVGCLLIVFGIILALLMDSFGGPGFVHVTMHEVWTFQAKDFYAGFVIFSLGVGMIIGNVVAFLVAIVKRNVH